MKDDIKETAFEILKMILDLELQVKAMMKMEVATADRPMSQERVSEAKANTMLAYRHLEDARVRLGKVCQAVDGGTPCYPR
jgi:uncharacterized protein YqfA (UPF0365 family)